MQNAFAESFIGRLRDELPNETLFRSLAHTRAVPGAGGQASDISSDLKSRGLEMADLN